MRYGSVWLAGWTSPTAPRAGAEQTQKSCQVNSEICFSRAQLSSVRVMFCQASAWALTKGLVVGRDLEPGANPRPGVAILGSELRTLAEMQRRRRGL